MSGHGNDIAVFFDLDGTVVEFTDPYAEILERVFAPHVTDPAQAAQEYAEQFHAAFSAHEPEPYRRAVRAVCETWSLDTDPELLAEDLLRAELDATRVVPGMRTLLEALGNHPLGICSNGTRRAQEAKLRRHSLEPFDAIVVSYDVGAHKPDPRMFDAAREAIDAERYVMVGDDFEADVRPAREAGFHAVHVDGDTEADTTVSGLDALSTLIDL